MCCGMDIGIYCIWVGVWTYGTIVCVLMYVLIGFSACVVEWTYGGTVYVLLNGHMEVLCVLVNGHMEVLKLCC